MVYINSDNLVSLTGVYQNGYINDATVSGHLYDRASLDNLCSFTLDYDSDTNGNYSGVIPYTTELTEDQKLLVVVTVVSDSYQDEFRANEVAGYYRLS